MGHGSASLGNIRRDYYPAMTGRRSALALMCGFVAVAIVALVAIGAGFRPLVPGASGLVTGAPAASSPVPAPTPFNPTETLAPRPTVRAVPPGSTPGLVPAIHATYAQLIGQKLVITMEGRTPSAHLLGRVKRGEIGGVVLLSSNIRTRAGLIALTGKLQAAAAAGGQATLLIAVDQEGGSVKRVPWAPPTLTVPEMGRLGSVSVARTQGAKTGAALRKLGINVDFAPVADVPRSTASFMYQQGRTFSFNAKRTAALADAFAAGLASRGILATMKHFPGIGLAKRNTDRYVDTIRASTTALSADLRPYRKAIGHDIPLIMLSNATYTAYDHASAAGWSRAVAVRLLRRVLGFTGVSITDSLSGTANARGVTVTSLAVRAAIAGTDMILVTGSESASRGVYATLLADARDGSIPLATLRASYGRILALKSSL
jgi:beta-N-acetylhexosaminidase